MDQNTILLVEDEVFFAMQEAHELEREGFIVPKAFSGEEAIAMVNAAGSAIDLVLMDTNLGAGMDGIQAAQEILKIHDIPIIFLSSETDPVVVAKTESIASYGYVLKNAGTTVLVASIKMAFKLHSAYKTIQQTNENLRLAQAASRAGTWDWNYTDNTYYMSPEFLKLFCLPEETADRLEAWKNRIHPEDLDEVDLTFRRALEQRTNVVGNYRIVLPGGEIRWIRATGQTFYKSGQPLRMIGLCMDITEQKLAEQAQQESETRLRSLSDNLPGGLVYQIDTGEDGQQRKFTYISAGVEQLHGITAEEALRDAMTIYNQISPEDRQELAAREAAAIQSMTPFSMEVRVKLPSGETKWRLFRSAPRQLPNRRLIWDGIEIEITDRKRVEEALFLSEEKFSKAFHSSPDAILITRLSDGKIIEVNEGFSKLSGYSRQEALSSTTIDLNLWSNPQDRAWTVNALLNNQAVRGREFDFNPKSGNKVRCLYSAEYIDLQGERLVLSVIHDITAIRQAEARLLESEQRYRTLVEIADDAITMTDLQGNHLLTNNAYYSSLGYTREDQVDLGGFDNVHPDDLPVVRAGMAELFEKGSSSGEYRVKHKDGHWIYRYNKATLIRDPEGKPQSILSIIRDTTRRKEMEEKMEQSEKHFRSLVENSYDAITLVGRDGRTSYQSPAVSRLNGHPADQTASHTALANVYPDDLPALQAAYERLLSQPGAVEHLEFRSVRKDGTIWWTEATATNLLEEPSVGAIVVNYRDITAHKQIETALQQALAEREILIRELQHRVKNSLATAAGLIGLECENLPDARALAVCTDIRGRLQSMSMLYDQLNQGDHINQVDLNDYLSNLVKRLAQAYLPPASPVQIETHFASLLVQANVALPLGLIVNELVTNALKYAFPDRQPGFIRIVLETGANGNTLCVSDNGVGLSQHLSVPDSPGMGLKLIKMLSEQLGGTLAIENQPGLNVRLTF